MKTPASFFPIALVLGTITLTPGLVRAQDFREIGPNSFEVLSYQASEYRFLIIPRYAKPPIGFEQQNFDDSAFGSGTAAFGSGDNCALQSTVQTPWSINSQLLLRRLISIPDGATNVQIRTSVDNDIIGVFFNGTRVQGPVRHEGCPILDQLTIRVPQQLVQPGPNLVVFDVLDRGVESFFDARILVELSPDVLSSSLSDLTDIIDLQIPEIPINNVTVACPDGSTEISVNYSVESTGSNGRINITQESLTDFTANFALDGKERGSSRCPRLVNM
jgi:hypothetical protein